ncbi:SDR family NAD(P)-dependent oxidoreductase [Pontibacillus yanchengensis]|uniref:Oxidoreductase n=1 Tax=Pontibacillus yanchengensis Y32 TaxID=1385514 RepID=A0A0A2TSB8_9BACI|nr:SDR family oxidoreductase [Pontibacillus yanchengensis]KGP72155.1 oxidoreductase [Pontibacillus yanchengensis Y32]
MNNKLKDKQVVITGASSGIGERIAWHVAEAGGIPIVIARRQEKLEELVGKLPVRGYWYTCDLADPEHVRTTFQSIYKDHGQIDVLVNNAGFGVFESINDTDMKAFQSMFNVNVLGLIQCVKEVLPHMIEHNHGHIVNIASLAGKMSTPKSAGYASTKHAVIGFTNALRLEMSSYSIFVTGVNLGPVRTSFFDTADPGGEYQASVERYMLDPDYVASRIVSHLYTSKREINMPGWMEVGAKLYQLMPGVMEKVFRSQFSKK